MENSFPMIILIDGTYQAVITAEKLPVGKPFIVKFFSSSFQNIENVAAILNRVYEDGHKAGERSSQTDDV